MIIIEIVNPRRGSWYNRNRGDRFFAYKKLRKYNGSLWYRLLPKQRAWWYEVKEADADIINRRPLKRKGRK